MRGLLLYEGRIMSDVQQQETGIYDTELSQSEYEALRSGEDLEDTSEEDLVPESEEEQESESHEDEIEEESDSPEDDEEDEEVEEDLKPKKKRKSGFKKRIDKLNQRISDRDREIEDLRSKLEERKSQRDEEPQKKVSNGDSGKPKRPVEDDYETYEEYFDAQEQYVEDLMDWKEEQREIKKTEKRKVDDSKAAYQKSVEVHTERINKFKETHPDFDKVVQNGLAGADISAAFEATVLDSDISAELIYHLAKNPETMDRISNLSPLKLAREIGKIESKISRANSSQKAETTRAPRPMTRVKGRGKGSAKSVYDAHEMSQAEFERARAKSMRRR